MAFDYTKTSVPVFNITFPHSYNYHFRHVDSQQMVQRRADIYIYIFFYIYIQGAYQYLPVCFGKFPLCEVMNEPINRWMQVSPYCKIHVGFMCKNIIVINNY